MASRELLYLHKETKLNLEPPSSSYLVDVKLPSVNSQGRRGPIRANNTEDEKVFRIQNCATGSSFYHRKHHAGPKSFLWRVLDDNTVLNLRAVDVCRTKKGPEANVVLNLRFPHPIRPSCLAFSDPKDHDVLTVFVVDRTNHLYTITLRPDHFRKPSASEAGLADSCKIYTSSGFSFKHPHRLLAVNDDLLVVTVHDGGNIRLDRNKAHDASNHPWKETFYNSKGWTQGFKSFLKGSHTVKYGGVNMDLAAATSVAVSDFGLNDNNLFMFTVCLDHRLRAWDLKTGQILEARDLLDAERNPQEVGKWTIDPSQSNLIQIVGATDGKRTGVTYSPIGTGEFKFWNIEADQEGLTIRDLFPHARLIPSPPSGSDVWTVADFAVAQDASRDIQIWILWKNNMNHQVQHLVCPIHGVEDAWQLGWTAAVPDRTNPRAPEFNACDPTDISEKWLEVILYPGRFTQATLETALSIYERGLGTRKELSSRSSQGLAEAICSAIASTSSLDRSSSGGMDYESFRNSSDQQWRWFCRLVLELDKQRGEALALAFDADSDLTWVVCADSLSAIRECNQLEQISHNPTASYEGLDLVASLVTTGLTFFDGFSDSMRDICYSLLRSELFEDSPKTDRERIQYFSDKAGFWRQTSDEDCAIVTDAFGQTFQAVVPDLYQKLSELMDPPADSMRESQEPLTEFGRKMAVRAVQQMAELRWNICFSQLILLVHMEFEFDNPEDALSRRLDIGTVYRYLIRCLRRLELVRWLAKTQITVPLAKTERSNSLGGSPVATKRTGEDTQSITTLEWTTGHLLEVPDMSSFSLGITNIASNFCTPDSSIELPSQNLQCALLVQSRSDLAAELAPFSELDPFSTYVQGRVHLAQRDFTTAATYFKKAAYGLSVTRKHADKQSSGLLDDTEWRLFYSGLPRYYCHIVALFERQKAHSYVVEFARLALEFVNAKTPDAVEVRTEIQSRLFSGAIGVSQFDLAHSTLVAMSDHALQHSCLRTLIQKMCDNLHNAELVQLPFPNLENAVDDILAQKCLSTQDVVTGVPYHQILYAWRIKRNDYRGAAAILLDRIHKLQQLGEADEQNGDDVLDTAVTRQYLMLINVLSCVDHKQAWIATEEPLSKDQPANGTPKRKVVMLADIRSKYQAELDRVAAIENNQFGFAAGDEMDVL
ncbi:nucleoporin [Apiospora saccharicola]